VGTNPTVPLSFCLNALISNIGSTTCIPLAFSL
jgi:hypothetical protein